MSSISIHTKHNASLHAPHGRNPGDGIQAHTQRSRTYRNSPPECISQTYLWQLQKFGEWTAKLAAEGKLIWSDLLHPTSKGARVVTDASGQTSVQHGPFEGSIAGGYVILNCTDLNEVIKIVESVPEKMPNSGVEIRPIMGLSDLGDMTEEQKNHAKQMRELMRKNAEALGTH